MNFTRMTKVRTLDAISVILGMTVCVFLYLTAALPMNYLPMNGNKFKENINSKPLETYAVLSIFIISMMANMYAFYTIYNIANMPLSQFCKNNNN